MLFSVIAEMDESKWDDKPGYEYHFPKRYAKMLIPGTRVVYYKGRLRDRRFREQRLSDEPHYFAIATIANVYPDPNAKRGELYAIVKDFQPFTQPLLAKNHQGYFEEIPANRQSNYWRDGVRPIDQGTFQTILEHAHLCSVIQPEVDVDTDDNTHLESAASYREGGKISYFNTKYERDPQLRRAAVKLHGVTCCACGFNFKAFYGDYAEGFIHIHHIQPVSEFGGEKEVNPVTDLVPLCANCHSVIHRRKDRTLSVDQLKAMIALNRDVKK
ncbi:TPA: HNH endonuclease [Serratia rubidaea]|nr:HNH endonuclease [Serratia rubidaea]HDJ1442458.1 HNH endonuclease [Serratia rubidaea]HDJ1446638.1 HNH endonuclease [Serratia rubidaea]HDJ1451387.1 HNH endonuclease [Serratia rubidaea]HDJ1460985.1 HNH endonuclease [Serratia rubidaea]